MVKNSGISQEDMQFFLIISNGAAGLRRNKLVIPVNSIRSERSETFFCRRTELSVGFTQEVSGRCISKS